MALVAADDLVLDLTDLQSMDATGFSALSRIANRAHAGGRRLSIRATGGTVRRVLAVLDPGDSLGVGSTGAPGGPTPAQTPGTSPSGPPADGHGHLGGAPDGRQPRPHHGDGFAAFARTRDPRLRDELVTAHLGLAYQLARRYAKKGEPFEDLVQVASMAIVLSVDRFDPECGVSFSTFATRTVLGELKRHFRDKGWLVRPPRRVQELALELRDTTQSLTQELGRSPTVRELMHVTGRTEEAVLEALEAEAGYSGHSLDAPGENGTSLSERIGTEDGAFVMVDDLSVLREALARLAPRERKILHLRFIGGMTQSQIAHRVGLSQMQISRLLSTSLRRLAEEFSARGEPPPSLEKVAP